MNTGMLYQGVKLWKRALLKYDISLMDQVGYISQFGHYASYTTFGCCLGDVNHIEAYNSVNNLCTICT